jgi:hypothetical protein
MRSIGRAIWTVLFVVLGSCLDKGEHVRLTSGPTHFGPTAVVLGAPRGLPAHGRSIELRIYLTPDGYHRDLKSRHGTDTAGYSGIYGTGDTEIKFAATLIGSDGTRRALDASSGASGPPNPIFLLFARPADAPRARPLRLEVTATVPVSVDSVSYWTGDPDSRCFPCL